MTRLKLALIGALGLAASSAQAAHVETFFTSADHSTVRGWYSYDTENPGFQGSTDEGGYTLSTYKPTGNIRLFYGGKEYTLDASPYGVSVDNESASTGFTDAITASANYLYGTAGVKAVRQFSATLVTNSTTAFDGAGLPTGFSAYTLFGNATFRLNNGTVSIPILGRAAAVPETATWAMMIIGFGLIGGMMRRGYRKSEPGFAPRIGYAATA